MIMVAHRKGGRIRWNPEVGTVPNILAQMPSRERAHPNEKPIEIIEQLVRTHTADADVVLDPFMGSGTTGVACAKLGRKFIGIEIEPKYFAIACRRIEQAYAQPDLYIAQPPQPKQEAML